jgi:hypothetical protein
MTYSSWVNRKSSSRPSWAWRGQLTTPTASWTIARRRKPPPWLRIGVARGRMGTQALDQVGDSGAEDRPPAVHRILPKAWTTCPQVVNHVIAGPLWTGTHGRGAEHALNTSSDLSGAILSIA